MAARPPAEDAVLVLQAHEVDVVDIQEVGGAAIGVDILFRQFKANAGRIGVAGFDVVDGQRDAGGLAVFGGDGLAQIGGEGGDAALARQVVADERNAADRCIVRAEIHREYPSCSCYSPFLVMDGLKTQRGGYP